jgi:hypothetical protein
MTSEIDVRFETLEQNHDDLKKVTYELMHGQKRMSDMIEEMWKFLKLNTTYTLGFAFEL